MKSHRAAVFTAGTILVVMLASGARGQGSQSSAPSVAGAAPQQNTQTPPPPTRVRLGGNVAAAQLLHMVPPVYPPIAKTARVQGTVVLHAVIAKDGTMKEVQYVSGPPLLLRSAMDAVKQWTYKPYLLNGEAVEVDTTISVVFTLGPGAADGATAPHGEEILLKDSSRLIGKITAVKGDKFEVQMGHSKIEVARSDIVSITFPDNRQARVLVVPATTAPLSTERKIRQSITGTTYTNMDGHFTLTVPEGWRTNDQLALKTPGTIGALSSADESSNIMIELDPRSTAPQKLAQLIDSMFQSSFEGYQKLSESPMTIDGLPGEALVFRAVMAVGNVSAQAGTSAPAATTVKIPAKYLVTMIKVDGGTDIVMCVAPEILFDKMQSIFTQITSSFRLLASSSTSPATHNL